MKDKKLEIKHPLGLIITKDMKISDILKIENVTLRDMKMDMFGIKFQIQNPMGSRLLLQTEYDINHSHNIIMLPRISKGVPVHALIQHARDHPK